MYELPFVKDNSYSIFICYVLHSFVFLFIKYINNMNIYCKYTRLLSIMYTIPIL